MSNVYGPCCCCMELACPKNLWMEYMWMGKVEVYGDMLKECFDLSLSPNQKTNEHICEVCITQLRHSMSFKRQVQECQVKLSNQISNFTKGLQPGVELDPKMEPFGNEIGNCDDDDFDSEDDIPIKSEQLDLDLQDTDLFTNEVDDHAGEGINTIKRHKTRKKNKDAKLKQDGRKLNFVKPRQNVCLILEHSTIVPFKSNKGYFNCFYCNKQYVVFDEIRAHVKQFHENATFKSIMKSVLRPHDRIRADVSEITCKICTEKQENIQELVQHLTIVHEVKFNESRIKPDECILPYDLADGKYKCCVCKNEFLFFKTLTKHMNEHSSNYVCDVCGKCFILPERLRAHAQMHTHQGSVKCQYCTGVYASNISLRSHIRYTHEKLSYLCSICNRTFPSSRTRQKHLEEVHGRSPLNLNCKLCSKNFKTPSSLNLHIKKEHLKIQKEAIHPCSECGIKFKSRYSLGCHAVVHTGEKNFECDVCHKKYSRASTLSEHLKIHLNDKRWSCGACSQTFVQKCSLKNHIRVHHSEIEGDQLIVYKKPDK